jgi:hypothetical protein
MRINGFFIGGACFLLLAFPAGAKNYPEVPFGNGGMLRGSRTLENVQANIRRIMPRIYYLYAQSNAGLKLREGDVHMWIVIDRGGKAAYVNVFKTTLNDEVFEDLLEATFSDFRFDEWKKGREKTEIIYPLEFRKQDALDAPRSRARQAWDKERGMKRE